jgi:tripartite-type tricarboxylate transporter receptor subunit TctC
MIAMSLCRQGRVGAWHRLTVAVIGTALATALSLAPAGASAQTNELVIPIAAGGAMDAATRAVGIELSRKWQEPVVPVNKPGAGMALGVRYLLGLNPDGRSLLAGGLPMTTSQFSRSGAPFSFDELAPIAYLGWQGTVLYIRQSIPATTVAEFVQWAKAQPKGVLFASSGVGSSPHIAAEEFAARTGITMVHVPYKGSGEFTPALIGGQVDAVFDAPSTRVHVQSGKLKALMFGGPRAPDGWADLPTADASGLAGFRTGTWYGFFTAAKTAAPMRQKLNADLNEAIASPGVRERLAQLGIEPGGGSPESFGQLLKDEQQRLGTLIRSRNIEIN